MSKVNKPKLVARPLCASKQTQNEVRNSSIDARSYKRQLEIDILARTLWGEARGEGAEGMEAVANVILNRVALAREKGGYWWGDNVIEVCQQPYQFSCWNKDDPNREKLINLDENNVYFVTAKRIATRAVLGFLGDKTKGATHYHARSVMPYWARSLVKIAAIGNHIFYKDKV